MRFKKVLCMTTLATLLFPVVQNIEYVDAAEYSIDIVVDTVEIDINDIPEDRCVKVGISLYNSPGINGVFFPLEKDKRLEFLGNPPLEYSNMCLSTSELTSNTCGISLYYGTELDGLIYDGCFCYIKFYIPQNVSINDFYMVNILNQYIYKSHENSDGIPFNLRFIDRDLNNYSSEFLNITNGGIRITGSEPMQTDPPQTDPPQTDPPQTAPPQTELPQTDFSQTDPPQTTSTTTELTTTTITTKTIATTTSKFTTTENTKKLSTSTSVTTTEETTSEATTKSTETNEVTESGNNENEKENNSLPIVLAILVSIGILGGIIGFIIKKSKGNKGK